MASGAADKRYTHLFVLLFCGDSSVGKTCLISRFADNEFKHTHISTIGIDFKLKLLPIRDKRIRLQIWDTAGQERYQTITPQYFRKAQGIMVVFDVTREDTFINITKWLRNVKDHGVDGVKVVLIGNKVDLQSKRQVSTRRGQMLANQHNIKYFETSALKDINVSEAFIEITEQILDKVEEETEGKTEEGSSIKLHDTAAAATNDKRCCSSQNHH